MYVWAALVAAPGSRVDVPSPQSTITEVITFVPALPEGVMTIGKIAGVLAVNVVLGGVIAATTRGLGATVTDVEVVDLSPKESIPDT